MRPDELTFYHRALASARQELELACACFPAEERREAVALAARIGSPNPGSSSLPSDSGPLVPTMAAYRGSLVERDAAIVRCAAQRLKPCSAPARC